MALTGGRIAASIYRLGDNDFTFGLQTTGRLNSFPNVGVMFYQAPLSTTAAGVTMQSIIEVLPTGLQVNSKKYYTDQTVTQLLASGT